jgi:Cu(I)/Ag(I) efflux system membrane protein CusA/SilA
VLVQPDQEGLVARVIRWSVAHRAPVLVILVVLSVVALGVVRRTQVDALPDLGEVQVIVRTSYPGQAPQVVEDQVTFPLTSALIAVPSATTVRGYSSFGDSFIYVLFADGTDPYWARERVFDYLNRAQARLPAGAHPALGPEATGLGWAYEYALVDRSGRQDIAKLRSLQDWWLRYELQSVEGVAEVATIGGMVEEYQVVVDPDRLRARRISLARVSTAIEAGNSERGGSVIEMAEAEYMVRASGYVKSLDDLRQIPLGVNDAGRPVTVGDVADVRLGPQMRRGRADLDGEGDVVGGVVLVRQGANPREVIGALKARLAQVAKALPPNVEIIPTYDRSGLIDRAIHSLGNELALEFAVVLLVCLLFLFHVSSGIVVIAVLLLGILAALFIMHLQGLTANVMSLGGIAVAIGAMVDAAIVMVENVHKRLERAAAQGVNLDGAARFDVIAAACIEVGPALLCSLLIIALSFLPVLALQGQELRLFAPLAYTKTYAMASAALLSIIAVPALICLVVRWDTSVERGAVVNRTAEALYRPALSLSLRYPRAVVGVAGLLVLSALWPMTRIGGEFMPEMDEGDFLYMPTTLPGIAIDAAGDLLQRTDRLIRTVPEVECVFGKAGRADSATDPAPLEMLETVVKLKPRELWRPGMTPEKLRSELDARVRLPGLTNSWLAPIKSRIDMLTTGVRTPIALTISGPDLGRLQALGESVERVLSTVAGADSVYSERVGSGRYIDVDIDRAAAARYGLNIADVQQVVSGAVGGQEVGETVEGRERHPINVRYPQSWRDSPERLRTLPIVTDGGAQITLGDVARLRVDKGPTMIRSEGARPTVWVNIVLRERDPQSFVRDAQAQIDKTAAIPAGYSLRWTGQYEYMQRAFGRLEIVIPCTLAVIVLLLYLTFRRFSDLMLILGALPLCLVGGYWLLWLLGYHMSVATAVGFIALAGVAAETGIVMLLYLNNAWGARMRQATAPTQADLREAIVEGALLRLRPKLMTVLAVIAGLLPIMIGGGTGSEVMRRIAAPMVGGMLTATLLTLLVVPALFLLIHGRTLEGGAKGQAARIKAAHPPRWS